MSMTDIESLKTMVHALDKRLTETDAWSRSGIENNAGNLQRIVDNLKDTRDQLYVASNGKPGLISLVNTWHYETIPTIKQRLDAMEKRQTWMLRLMGSALMTLAGSLVLLLVKK